MTVVTIAVHSLVLSTGQYFATQSDEGSHQPQRHPAALTLGNKCVVAIISHWV